jgi:hypothetical protein
MFCSLDFCNRFKFISMSAAAAAKSAVRCTALLSVDGKQNVAVITGTSASAASMKPAKG